MKDSGQYTKIYVNHGISNLVDLPVGQKNLRPDIMAVRLDGTIDLVEVASKTDHADVLTNRMMDAEQLFGDRAGKHAVLTIPEIFSKGMNLYG